MTTADNSDFIELERGFLGLDHLAAGRLLAEKWHFPQSLAEVTSCHHWPEKATGNMELAHIVYLADLLPTWFLAGLERERINTESLVQRLAHIDLTPSQLESIIVQVPWNTLMYL